MQGIEAWGEYSLGTVMITIVSDNLVGCKAVFGGKTLVGTINH